MTCPATVPIFGADTSKPLRPSRTKGAKEASIKEPFLTSFGIRYTAVSVAPDCDRICFQKYTSDQVLHHKLIMRNGWSCSITVQGVAPIESHFNAGQVLSEARHNITPSLRHWGEARLAHLVRLAVSRVRNCWKGRRHRLHRPAGCLVFRASADQPPRGPLPFEASAPRT